MYLIGKFYVNHAYIVIREEEKGEQRLPKVNISFKQTSRDMRLYTTVISQEEKSDFVKDAIEFYVKYLEKEEAK